MIIYMVNRIKQTLLILIVGLTTFSSCYAQDKPFILNSGANEPLFNTQGTGFYNLLADEIFKRLDVKIKAIKLPSERALINVNKGIDDGNIARIKGLEKKYPNLIRVPEKVFDFEFMAYAKNSDLEIKNWDSLQPYVVGILTGWKIYEKNISDVRQLTKVKSPGQLFMLLENKRADVVMFDRWQGLWWVKQLAVNVELIEPPIAKKEMYIYLHKKHSRLVPEIAAILVEMKRDGSYQKIFKKTLKQHLKKHNQNK